MENSESKILNQLVKEISNLAGAIKLLTGTQKEVQDTIEKNRNQRDSERLYLQSLYPDASSADIDAMLTARSRAIAGNNYGFSGLYKRLTNAQFPSGEEAVSLLGYSQSFRNTRLGRAYTLGALIQQSFSPQTGVTDMDVLGFSQQQMDRVLGIERTKGGNPKQPGALDANLEAALRAVDTSQNKGVAVAYEKIFGESPVTSPQAIERNRRILLTAAMSQGGNLYAALAQSDNPAVRSLANRAVAATSEAGAKGLAARGMFKIGGSVMLGARMLAGPIGLATTAGQIGYGVGEDIYAPTRRAAGLGYGFSYDPLNYGAKISLNRSIATKLTPYTFGAFGVSGAQAEGARMAIEGMGAGGPGQENLYNRYYGSMVDVMQETGFDAQQIAPFYEMLLRQSTGAGEVEKLTNMLKNDIPKAAAASRMSLGGMLDMIQKTTEAAAQNPLAAAGRTRFEIAQSLASAAQAGGPAAMQPIAAGANPLVVAQTASRLGTGYFVAAQEAGQLQATTAELLKTYLGDMSAQEFAEFRRTNQGAVQVMAVGNMLGLSPEDIQRLYDIGLDDYAAGSVFTDAFSEDNLGTAEKGQDLNSAERAVSAISGEVRGMFGLDPLPEDHFGGKQETISQKIRGTNFDLYKRKGRDLRSLYQQDIKALENALANMGGGDLEDFQKKMKELEGEQAIETYRFLQETAEKVAGGATRDDKLEGLIDLSDEAKKYFKLNFESGPSAENLPNENTNYGGTGVGRR